MKWSSVGIAFVGAAAALWTLAADEAQAEMEPHELARFAGPTFLENLWIAPGNVVYLTNYTGRRIEILEPDGGRRTMSTGGLHPVSLLGVAEGVLLVAHAVAFTEGEAFLGSGRLLRLSTDGTVLSDLPLDELLFPNGVMAAPAGDGVLIADSVGARIAHVDPGTGVTTTFFADGALAPQPGPDFRPGVNGLKRDGDGLVLSSSANRALYRLSLDERGQP